MVATEGTKTGLGITLWQNQNNGDMKWTAFGSEHLYDTEKKKNIQLEALVEICGFEKIRFYLYGKKYFYYTNH